MSSPPPRYGFVGLRLQGTGFSGWSSAALELPDGLPAAAAAAPVRLLHTRLRTDAQARERSWVVLGGPILRMHSQPARGHKRQKLLNLCWLPPVCSIVEHYTAEALTCEEVLERAGLGGRDEADDPVEVLGRHFSIDCRAAFVHEAETAHSDGAHSGPVGWEEEGARQLYGEAGGRERVVPEWWDELVAALGAGHPTFLLGERLELATVRAAKKRGLSYSHCMLVVGYEGTPGAPRSSDRRDGGERGAQSAPRLLLKDPCQADRLLEATFEPEHGGGGVHLNVFSSGGRSSLDRYRVSGSVQFSGVMPGTPQDAAGDENSLVGHNANIGA